MSGHWLGDGLYAIASDRFLRAVVYPASRVEPSEYVEKYAIAGESAARMVARRLKRGLRRRLRVLVNAVEPFSGILLPFPQSAMARDERCIGVFDLARHGGCRTALIVGAEGGAGLTEACLAGVLENPGAPLAFCVGSCTLRFHELQRRYRNHPRLHFRPLPAGGRPVRLDGVVEGIMQETAIDRFDLALFDASTFGDDVHLGSAHRAKVVLVKGANTAPGYRHLREVLTLGTYAVTAHDIEWGGGYVALQAEPL